LRALRDQRLGRLHLRTLGIIAAFDRLGKNGSGCRASQNKIAAIARVDKSRLSRSLSDLRDFGYISLTLNPDNAGSGFTV
jgi:DNA-binding MarR family transcriptional regulator